VSNQKQKMHFNEINRKLDLILLTCISNNDIIANLSTEVTEKRSLLTLMPRNQLHFSVLKLNKIQLIH